MSQTASDKGGTAVLQKLSKASVHLPKSGPSGIGSALRRFRNDRCGGVALIAGVSFVPLVMAVGIGIELTHWTTIKAELQRTADLSALAGVREYLINGDHRRTVDAAANLAELNGAQGDTARTWNSDDNLLTDNQITAQVTAGVRRQGDKAVKVTVRQTVPLLLMGAFGSTLPVTIAATGWADVSVRMQPCLLALNKTYAGPTGITDKGNAFVKLKDCSVRSNTAISAGGSSRLWASAFYAADTITGNEFNETGGPPTMVENNPTINDPYANYSPVQNALVRPKPAGICASNDKSCDFSNKPTENSPALTKNIWNKWDIAGKLTLNAGIYYVYGDISLGAQAELSGTGVTIVTSGTVKMTGGSKISLTAAKTADTPTGAIPGVVFIGSSTGTSSFLGSADTKITGVVYNPNGALDFGGTAHDGSEGCLEVIASSIALTGNSGMASKCSSYGTLQFSSEPQISGLAR
jgi:Flp pilus assembly protein TadG